MTLILRQIGHDAHVLYGGYKEDRRGVRDYAQSEISEEVEGFRFILMSGNTGNGKSRILEALRESGEQACGKKLITAPDRSRSRRGGRARRRRRGGGGEGIFWTSCAMRMYASMRV